MWQTEIIRYMRTRNKKLSSLELMKRNSIYKNIFNQITTKEHQQQYQKQGPFFYYAEVETKIHPLIYRYIMCNEIYLYICLFVLYLQNIILLSTYTAFNFDLILFHFIWFLFILYFSQLSFFHSNRNGN